MTNPPQDPVTIYTPGSALRQPSLLLADMSRDIWRGRGLARARRNPDLPHA